MIITRSSLFVVIAFVLALLATLIAGGVITGSSLTFDWLLSGSLTSYFLSLLV